MLADLDVRIYQIERRLIRAEQRADLAERRAQKAEQQALTRSGPSDLAGVALVPVKLPGTAIAARTGTGPYTVSSGTANLCTQSGSTLTVASDTTTVWNPYPTALPTSKIAWCAWWNDKLWVIVVEC